MDQIENLTVQQLRELFNQMSDEDVQYVVNALRALAGDTESFTKLQRLHVSIEQGINKLLKMVDLTDTYTNEGRN